MCPLSRNMASFLDKHEDFILKLQIAPATGKKQIRRVSLSRIADVNGIISYEKLISLVLVFTLPEENITTINTGNHVVSLSYYDKENDMITVASTEELVEAVEMFTKQKFIRITTSVKQKNPYSASLASAAAFAQDASASSAAAFIELDQHTSDPRIRTALESFAGILSTAVHNLQEGLATQSSNLKGCDEKNGGTHKDFGENKRRQHVNEVNEGVVDKGWYKQTSWSNATPCTNNNPCSSQEPNQASCQPKSSDSGKRFLNDAVETDHDTKEIGETKLFIHGRHTCDNCLTTPIIGKRYHSTNLDDYDLCRKCFDNYKGNEIEFEAVELARDAALQKRWGRRYKATNLMKRPGRGNRVPRGVGHRGENNSDFNNYCLHVGRDSSTSDFQDEIRGEITHDVSTSPSLPRISHHSSAGQLNHNKPDPISATQDDDTSSKEFQNRLEEAIRRSLDDIGRKEHDSTMETNETDEAKSNCFTDRSELIKEPKIVNDEALENDSCDHTDNIPPSVDIVEHKTDEYDPTSACGVATSDNTNASVELKEVEFVEEVVSNDFINSEELPNDTATLTLDTKKPLTDDCCTTPCSKRTFLDYNSDSFALDAIGNGDVAEEIGKTFDMMAGVITDMLSESLQEPSPIKRLQDLPNEGEVVVSPSDDDEEWSVVKSIGSNTFGNAAEMLGSALFNSEMETFVQDNNSDFLDQDSSLSIPSSVPTDIATVDSHLAGPSQVTRWAKELEKLRELGFGNEASCIDVLERIESSNGGSESDEVVSNIDRAVNELLELNTE